MLRKNIQDKIKALNTKKHSVKLTTIYDVDKTKVDEVINDAQKINANLRGKAGRRATRDHWPN